MGLKAVCGNCILDLKQQNLLCVFGHLWTNSGVYLKLEWSSTGDCWKRLDVHKEIQHLNMDRNRKSVPISCFGSEWISVFVTRGEEKSADVCKAVAKSHGQLGSGGIMQSPD